MNESLENMPHYLERIAFYNAVKKKICECNANLNYVLVSLDLDNFNYINDLFSYEIGNSVLNNMTIYFSEKLREDELFSRIHADHFKFLLHQKSNEETLARFHEISDMKSVVVNILPLDYSLVISAGIVKLTNSEENLASYLDKANYARKLAKETQVNQCYFYDEEMKDSFEWKKIVTLMMEHALLNDEFKMYLQPKVMIDTGVIIGSEALVRWETTKYGMIYPDRFIPIFEQNGFITHIDFHILEKACKFIKNSIKNGIVPLPIAVNFSRVHILDEGFVEHVFQVVNHCGVSPNLIEIEFTESIYLNNADALIEVISNLRYLGFSVALDDFGSAYSSLNYLKELPVDVIKIDKEFLSKTTKSNRGKTIITKVVELIKSLKIISVMEGVETPEELNFLAKIGCNIGQGYLFSKAIPTSEFITFVKQGKTLQDVPFYLEQGIEQKNCEDYDSQEFIMDNWELYTLGKNVDMGLMKGYLDDDYRVQYVNERALEYLGISRKEFREIYDNSIRAFTHPEDEYMVIECIQQLKEGDKSIPFKTRAICKDGTIIVLQGRASSIIDNQGRKVGIYAFRDVSEELQVASNMQLAIDQKIKELKKSVIKEKQNKKAIQALQDAYKTILNQSNDVSFEWDLNKDYINFSQNYKERFGLPMSQNNVMDNSYIKEYVSESDIEKVMQYRKDIYQNSGTHEVGFHLKAKDGTYTWMTSFATALCDDEGIPFKVLGIIKNKY